ncbi:MAG TPA: choice-of-anchor D domain-containing protein [Solirubrobacterales bacterium]
MIALAACLIAAASPLPGSAASHSPRAGVAKKCKKRKHRHKKRRCKRSAPAPAMISISPASQDFGIVHLPQGPTRSFVIINMGGSPSGVPIPSVAGSNPENFSVVANSCAAPLGPGLTCQIDVDLLPQGHGPVMATLNLSAIPGGTASAAMTGRIEA